MVVIIIAPAHALLVISHVMTVRHFPITPGVCRLASSSCIFAFKPAHRAKRRAVTAAGSPPSDTKSCDHDRVPQQPITTFNRGVANLSLRASLKLSKIDAPDR
jgi:hypothetical protein